MTTSPYNVQQLANQAYGWINATAATSAGFGCSMTRVATGLYRLELDASSGVLDGQSWVVASAVQNNATASRIVTPVFVSNTRREFSVVNDAGTVTDCDVEVIVFKTSVNVTGV